MVPDWTAACLASGTTVIDAAACEPEVVDLGRLLIAMGARIAGLGTSQLIIDGVEELSGADHSVIPDRIEAATLMIAAAMIGGDVTIQNVVPEQMTATSRVPRPIASSTPPTSSIRPPIHTCEPTAGWPCSASQPKIFCVPCTANSSPEMIRSAT